MFPGVLRGHRAPRHATQASEARSIPFAPFREYHQAIAWLLYRLTVAQLARDAPLVGALLELLSLVGFLATASQAKGDFGKASLEIQVLRDQGKSLAVQFGLKPAEFAAM